MSYSPKSWPRTKAALFLSVLLAIPACHKGDGSVIPPLLPGGPDNYVSTPVINQASEPIVGTLASVAGSTNTAAALRTGRFYLPDPSLGQVSVTIDPTNGTATGSDEFPRFVYRPGISAGKAELGRAVVLPDLLTGTSSTLPLGTLASPVTVDASSTAGARLSLATGTILSQPGQSGNVKVSLARVEKDQLPLDLPSPASGVLLAGRGIWLTPVDLEMTGGSKALTIDNDLGLANGQKADLMRLDPVSGVWNKAGTGTVQSAGTEIQSDAGVLAGGGIYVFTISVTVSTSVSGKVVDESDNPIPGAHVIVGEAGVVLTDPQGDFVAPSVAQQDASGTPLQLPLFVLPPLGYAPAIWRGTFAAMPNSTSVGTIKTKSYPVTNLQTLAVIQGRGLGHARIFHGGGGGNSPEVYQEQGLGEFSTSTVTQSGVVTRRDVPLGWYRVSHSFVLGGDLYRQPDDLVSNMNPSFEFNTMTLFVRSWPTSSGEVDGRTLCFVMDAEGGAPLEGAVVQSPTDSTTTRFVTLEELGSAYNSTNRFEDQTAVYESKLPGGLQARSAFTTGSIDNFRVEYPLITLKRQALGRFESFGVIQGTLQGSIGGQDRKALPQPGYSVNDWFGLALTGRTYMESIPQFLEPSTTSQSYRLGLPTQKANLVISEGVTNAADYTPQRLGILTGLRPRPGYGLVQDLDLSLALSSQLTLTGVLASLDSRIGAAGLRYRLGAAQNSLQAIDLLPLSAGVTTGGSDATVPVPPLSGALAGASYLVAFGGTATTSGVTVGQHLYLQTGAGSVAPGDFLAVPAITAPAANATVPKTGFDVTWTQANGTYFYELDLRSVNGTDDRYWAVILPSDRTSFTFGALVAAAPQILEGGRTWTLTLSAYSVDHGVAEGWSNGYQRILGNLYALRPGERGVRARSLWKQTITTSP
mgnify:CR=1 FL=1